MKKNPIRLPFELDPKLDDSLITAYAGLPLVVEMFRSTGGALYNVLSALRHLTFPPELQTARPKRLRFLLFNTVGRVVRHAREMLMKMALEYCQWMFDFSRLRIHLKPAT